MFCSKCGMRIGDGDIFCTVCGARVIKEEPKPQQTFEEPFPPISESQTFEENVSEQPAYSDVSEIGEAATYSSVNGDASVPVEPEMSVETDMPSEVVKPIETESFATMREPIGASSAPVYLQRGEKHGKREKQYFGKGALVFCIIVIAILSVACGILSGLLMSKNLFRTNNAMSEKAAIVSELDGGDNGTA